MTRVNKINTYQKPTIVIYHVHNFNVKIYVTNSLFLMIEINSDKIHVLQNLFYKCLKIVLLVFFKYLA